MRLGLGEQTQKTKFKSEARNRIWNGPEDNADPFKGQKKSFSKVPFVGTLNLYLVTPDAMQKTKNWSDHPGLRKRPKTAEKLQYLILSSFQQFLDVFSAQDDRINFSSFALHQASQDTSLEYPQRVLWRNFFLLLKGSALSSRPFQVRFRASDLNFIFCVCSPKPNCTFLEPRQIRYWKKLFFNTPYDQASNHSNHYFWG